MDLLEFLQKENREIPVIVVSAYGTVDHVRNGFKIYNLYDYFSKQHFDRHKYQKSVKQASKLK